MPHPSEIYQNNYTGNFIVLVEYLGGYNVAGSGSWVAELYAGPAANWREIVRKGKTNFIRNIKISELELTQEYTYLGSCL